jgi:glucose/mannose transport system substrate-binding protein
VIQEFGPQPSSFESTPLGVIGPKGWTDLFTGAMQWDDPKVKEAVKLFAKMLNYVNPDHSAQSWDQAIKTLIVIHPSS